MERPRRHARPPGALSDYLTRDVADKRSVCVEESTKEQTKEEQEGEEEEEDAKEPNQTEADRRLVLSQPYKCKECKARYRSRVALSRHAVKHSGEKPFVCRECGRGLSSQCALTEHMSIHTNNRPHRCEECGLESRQLSVHLRHLLTHQAQPHHLYTCSVCSKTFKQNEYLKKHMRKHTGEKPFACKMCCKSFTCKSELNRHSKRHSTERPHSCADCGKSFKMKHNLHNHLRAHAGTQQWKCLLCSAVFSKLKLLEAHKKTHLETVQQLHISRPDDSVLVISAEGDDRRRLPTVHTVVVPKESLGGDASDINSKKHLRINDTSLPLELILKSVGKGGNIKIKIIDKPAQPRIQSCVATENIVELVDEDASKPGGLSLSQDPATRPLHDAQPPQDSELHTVNQEAVKVASVLSVAASVHSHCLAKHYHHLNPACSDFCCWLATFVSLCQQLQPPFEPEICKHLSFMMTALQNCLLQEPGCSRASQGPGVGYCLACHTHPQYQVIYKQYRAVQEVLNAHFAHHAAAGAES